jgi:glycine betaine/proline transport system ATP-binding protein
VAVNVAYGLKIRGVGAGERRERALQALDQVRLGAWADYRPEALSGGMQQRVGLARGLAADPEILLMDEPFSALDPLIRRDMQLELLELQNKLKKTIVFITHDLNEALILGDHIAIMKEGRFVQVGTAPEIVGDPADDYVAAFTRDVERARVFTCEAVMENAHALDLAADTPQTALERMNGLDRTALYARDDGRLAGIVTYRDLVEATHRNGADLAAFVSTDYPTASPDTHLYRLYGECARGLPIAILGEDGDLVAVAEPEAVFAKLAVSRDEDGQSAGTDARS